MRPGWNQNMVAQPYIIPGQGNISHQNNMSSHIKLCDVLDLLRMSYVLTSVAAFIHWIPMYNPYPLLLPDYENTERESPYWLVDVVNCNYSWREGNIFVLLSLFSTCQIFGSKFPVCRIHVMCVKETCFVWGEKSCGVAREGAVFGNLT